MSNSEVSQKVLGRMVQSVEQELNRNRLGWLICFPHVHRTTVTLHTGPRGRYWLEYGSRCPVDEIGKNMKALTNGLDPVD